MKPSISNVIFTFGISVSCLSFSSAAVRLTVNFLCHAGVGGA